MQDDFSPTVPNIEPAVDPIDERSFDAVHSHGRATAYRHSEDVRHFLVLLALRTGTRDLSQELRAALPVALGRVIAGLQSGHILIDYSPQYADRVDIPTMNHAHYMQALLYWTARLDCSMERLAEAHARLGKAPKVAHVQHMIEQIENEENLADTHMGSTHQEDDAPDELPRARGDRPPRRAGFRQNGFVGFLY